MYTIGKKYTILLSIVLTACGGGESVNTPVTTGCVSTIVSELASMASPQFVGYGLPDSTTFYPVQHGEHQVVYVFESIHKQLIFVWTDQGMCLETAVSI